MAKKTEEEKFVVEGFNPKAKRFIVLRSPLTVNGKVFRQNTVIDNPGLNERVALSLFRQGKLKVAPPETDVSEADTPDNGNITEDNDVVEGEGANGKPEKPASGKAETVAPVPKEPVKTLESTTQKAPETKDASPPPVATKIPAAGVAAKKD